MDIKPPQPYSHDEIAAALTLIDLSSSPRAQAQLLQQAQAAQLAQQQLEAQKHYSNDMDTSETGSATLVETLPALQINTDPRLQTSPPMTHASSTHQIPPSPLTQSPLLQTNVENISPNQLSAAQQLLSTLSREQQQQLQHQININHQQISQQQLIQTTTLEQQQQAANAAVASALASVAAQQHKEQIIRATMAGSPNTINTISHGPISINTSGQQQHHHTNSIPILKQNFGQLISTPTQLLHKQQAVAAAQRIVPNTQQQVNGGARIQQGSIILSSSPNTNISTSAPINSGQLAAAQHFLLQEHQNQNTLHTTSSLQANNSIPITIQKAAAAKLIQTSHQQHPGLGGSLPFNNSDSLFGSAGQSPPKTTNAHHPYLTNPTIKLLQNQSRTNTNSNTTTDGTTGLPITIRSKATSSGSIPSFGVGSLPTMSNHHHTGTTTTTTTQGVQVINGQPQFTTGGFVQQMPILGNGGGPIEPRRRTISNSGTRKRGDSKKCRKVFGIENKDQWCKACIWKKACQRFPD